MRNTESEKSLSASVRAAVLSSFDKAVSVLLAIFEIAIAIGITVKEFDSLAGNAGTDKLQRIAEFIRDTIRGVKHDLSASTSELAQKLGLIDEAMDITPPEGGKVFRVLTFVDWARAWVEYILSCCPQTGLVGDICKVLEQYLTDRKGCSLESTYLVWFGKKNYKTTSQAKEWVTFSKLEWAWAHPRITFSIIGFVSNIVDQLNALGYCYDSVGIVTGQQCKLDGEPRVPYAWLDDDGDREASLHRVSDELGGGNLFAFVRT